jgi:WD40 repeat protein
MRLLHSRKQFTTSLAFSPSGDKLAVGGSVCARGARNRGRMDIWDLGVGEKRTTLPSLPDFLKMAFTPDGALAVAFPDRVMLYSGSEFQNSTIVQEWNQGNYRIVSFSSDGTLLLVHSPTVLHLVDLRPPFSERWSSPARTNPGGAAFSPDGRRLAVAGERSVEIRDSGTGEPVASFENPMPPERFMGFDLIWSTDGRWVAEEWQQWVNVWDTSNGRFVFQKLPQNREGITAAAFHGPTGRLGIAFDFALRLFEPEVWQEKIAYQWPVGPTSTLAFDKAGFLGAIGGDKCVALWDVDW